MPQVQSLVVPCVTPCTKVCTVQTSRSTIMAPADMPVAKIRFLQEHGRVHGTIFTHHDHRGTEDHVDNLLPRYLSAPAELASQWARKARNAVSSAAAGHGPPEDRSVFQLHCEVLVTASLRPAWQHLASQSWSQQAAGPVRLSALSPKGTAPTHCRAT